MQCLRHQGWARKRQCKGKGRLTQSHAQARRVDAVGWGGRVAGVGITQSLGALSFRLLGFRRLWESCRVELVRYCSQNSTWQGKAKRRELLPRVSSREIQISGAVAQTIRVGGISTSAEGFPGGKLRLKGSHIENFQEGTRRASWHYTE